MPTYIISLEELLWGSLLVAITMVIHGAGMFLTLRFIDDLKARFHPRQESFEGGLSLVILASLMIVLTNAVEVVFWAVFFVLQGAQPTHSIAVYNVLLNYTQGALGDALHAISCAAGYNLRWLLRAIARLGLGSLFLRLLRAALAQAPNPSAPPAAYGRLTICT